MKKETLIPDKQFIRTDELKGNNHLTAKDYFVYGSASIGDALAYSMVGSFLMFFLTSGSD